MSRWHRGAFDSPFSSTGDFVPFSIFGEFANEHAGRVADTMELVAGVDPRALAVFAPFATLISEADVGRLARAVAMSRAAELLGAGDWYLGLARDVLVSGLDAGQPWNAGGVILRSPRRAVARAGGNRVIAEDIISAVAVSEALIANPESREELERLARFDLR